MSLVAYNITFKYFDNAKTNIISNINLTLPEGTITVLSGNSGSGKSTLAYVMAGLYPENAGFLTSGKVMWKDVEIHSLSPDKRVQYVTMMFQNADLQFCMNNLEQELEFCLENKNIPEDEHVLQIHRVVNRLEIPHLLGRPFHMMSGGEKQLCALACILLLDSVCIILDEAFANIDVPTANKIISILKESGKTILAIDHQVSLWAHVMDRHAILNVQGSIETIDDVKMNAQGLIETIDCVKMNSFGLDVSIDNITSSRDRLETMNYNKMNSIECNERAIHEQTTVLQVENASVRDIRYPNMKFHKGCITAIMGPSGCGKTSLFQTLIGQNKYNGTIEIKDKSLHKWKKKHLYRTCGIVFQNPSNQFLALNVYDEVYTSVKQWYPKHTETWKKERTLELLDMFGLKRYIRYSPYLLSQGQQRRLAVLTMIAGNQEILLLDEPTYGQDGENIKVMMELLVQKAKEGLTIVFTTHNENIASSYAHSIVTL